MLSKKRLDRLIDKIEDVWVTRNCSGKMALTFLNKQEIEQIKQLFLKKADMEDRGIEDIPDYKYIEMHISILLRRGRERGEPLVRDEFRNILRKANIR
ncbi:hypothetical protein GF312_13595 [Candidatus Poribacteria bacterium]|nr:hypothetical protein [Candidatus Poribacteria bacterium]